MGRRKYSHLEGGKVAVMMCCVLIASTLVFWMHLYLKPFAKI